MTETGNRGTAMYQAGVSWTGGPFPRPSSLPLPYPLAPHDTFVEMLIQGNFCPVERRSDRSVSKEWAEVPKPQLPLQVKMKGSSKPSKEDSAHFTDGPRRSQSLYLQKGPGNPRKYLDEIVPKSLQL